MDDTSKRSLDLHEQLHGKIEVVSRKHVETRDDLSLMYTPGVAEPCRQIQADYQKSWELTRRGNMVAVITDGTAILGLGDIGPAAGMPVMEGKCALFKEFGDVDAFPLCVDTHDVDEFVRCVQLISKSFGGINLEDIAAPRCFEIEEKLKRTCDIPVFHDDQHGTAIVVAAALINALKVTGKTMGEVRIVINGAGAAGCAIGTLLSHMGFGNVIMCDINGIICEGDEGLNPGQEAISHITNADHEHGTLADALRGADAFVGVSRPNLVSTQMVSTMNDGIVFAMANPTPEIMPDEALRGGAAVVGTGRSDFPNQINNVLVFPGIFKGALAARAREITEEMEVAAAYAIASVIPDDELSPTNIIASALDKTVADVVAKAVADHASA
ncbi:MULTISPECIES: NAD(P)-dependent malic enzyme [Atopobiaceae]|uniref:Malate dehydrogenase (Oxaloacetate-decarboxylating) n=1 Tax=Parafannyhessea umbonata TaxID=604330 RepID=A0A1H6IVB6_9ACTN|nr:MULTISPECIES: NADP-dependent malic enzyme [Atopobiaceae]SEH50495.1 malate dehydrogenase (oxaloacetate-decarboxylating) [Parafannyhessea umbonata]SJZ76862.1 malate dehydrogenase (oxaloacetate-decarboxylating) [Olsenella sp. KH1P3]